MVRTPCCDKSGIKKGTWTPEEDRKLVAYVTQYGCWNWRQLPKFAGLSRCGKSCRLRWLNYLKPNIKRGNFTREEDETIIRLHESLGNRWSVIAAQLSGRTDNEIKNHWHANLKKHVKQDKATQEEPKSNNEIAQDEQLTANGNFMNPTITSPLTVESYSLTPQPSSSDFSSTTTEGSTIDVTSIDLILDDGLGFLDSYETSIESFWGDTFLIDDTYYATNDLWNP